MEFRKDYILERWALISEGRGKRPHELSIKEELVFPKEDMFASGNESMTPPEIRRTGGEKWTTRTIWNKFPALSPSCPYKPKTDNKYFTWSPSCGYHWVLVETPGQKQLAELSEEEITNILNEYKNIILDLETKPDVAYVNVFKNHGAKAGTSIVHSHSQIIATPMIPPHVKEEILAARKFIKCPYCEIIEVEKNSERRITENEDFIAFCPYASTYNYEAIILPKKHLRRMEELNLENLAKVMKKILTKLHAMNASYNYYIHYSPKSENYHFHIKITPRTAIWAGFELESAVIINSVPPEEAARYYRE